MHLHGMPSAEAEIMAADSGPAFVQFVYREEPSLPLLAWGACMRRHTKVVEVVHGPWVETRADCFFEGCWDGPFGTGRLDETTALFGSGGRLVDGEVRFAAPSHMFERLQSIATGDRLYVANSLPLLLVIAGETLDLDHSDYFFDYLRHYRSGIGVDGKQIRLASGRIAAMHYCGNLIVRPDLSAGWREKIGTAPPGDFREHADGMRATLGRLFDNASDRRRRQPFRPLVTMSKGYDSTATTALAVEAGCREAVSFRQSQMRSGGNGDDSGAAIGACLGLEVTLYERLDYLGLAGLPDAEFFVNPRVTTDKAMAVMAAQMAGALVITGRYGENLWGRGPESGQPLFREPNALLMSGATLTDFRLRVGFVHLPLPTTAAQHAPVIRRLTDAAEMRPWSLGGDYDRPIPRRIAEEAGIPRELFGQRKMGGTKGFNGLTAACSRDFLEFRDKLIRAGHRLPSGSGAMLRRFKYRLRRHPEILWPLHRLLGDLLHPRWQSPDLYMFHWGVDHLLKRYQAARPTRFTSSA
jgi:hypothetical protein